MVKLFNLILIITLCSSLTNLFAQSTFQKVYNQNNDLDFITSLTPTMDGGTVFFSVLSVRKVSCTGNIEWAKNIKSSYSEGALLELENGDIIVTYPIAEPNSSYRRSINVIRFDAVGNVLWQKKYGKLHRREYPKTLLQTQDGGFLISGEYKRFPEEEYEDFYFLKIDSIGNVLWTKTFGEETVNNKVISSIKDFNGNTIHIGISENGDSSIFNGNIIKLDSLGEVKYYKKIANSTIRIFPRDLIMTSNGNQLCVGSYFENDTISKLFFIKINEIGEIVYAKNLGTNSLESSELGLSITSQAGGGYAIMGRVNNGFPQYTLDAPFPSLLSIYTLDESENFTSATVYEYYGLIAAYGTNPFHIENRMDRGFNISFTNKTDTIGSNKWEMTLMQLDENLMSSCNEYDVSDSYYLSENMNWTLIDENIIPLSHGEEYDFGIIPIIEDYLHDTIITLCENIAKADFTFENPCPNESVYFTDQSSGNIISRTWNFDNGAFISEEENPVVEFSGTGVFPVQLIVSDDCVTDTLLREIEILPTFFEELDTTVCSERPIYFHNNIFTETVDEAQTFTYIDTLTNYLGCDSIVTLTALVEPCGCELIFPNVFTPDNDGINDVFYPIIKCDFMVENYRLLIFNRWGQLVFESQNPTEQWDGIYKDKPLPMDVLIYKVQYDVKDEDGIDNRQVNQVGDITLIR